MDDKVRLTKYYGKVPRDLIVLKHSGEEEEEVETEVKVSQYVEAVVVIANGGTLLKARRKPIHDARSSCCCIPLGCCTGTFLGSWYL
jgi:hypothetical protein